MGTDHNFVIYSFVIIEDQKEKDPVKVQQAKKDCQDNREAMRQAFETTRKKSCMMFACRYVCRIESEL